MKEKTSAVEIMQTAEALHTTLTDAINTILLGIQALLRHFHPGEELEPGYLDNSSPGNTMWLRGEVRTVVARNKKGDVLYSGTGDSPYMAYDALTNDIVQKNVKEGSEHENCPICGFMLKVLMRYFDVYSSSLGALVHLASTSPNEMKEFVLPKLYGPKNVAELNEKDE